MNPPATQQASKQQSGQWNILSAFDIPDLICGNSDGNIAKKDFFKSFRCSLMFGVLAFTFC